MLKLFKVNDTDWFAAESLEGAKQAVMECFGPPAPGQTREEFYEEILEDPYEVGDEHLDTLTLVGEEYDDEDDRDEKGEPKRKRDPDQTFRQVLAAMKSPGYFASTEN